MRFLVSLGADDPLVETSYGWLQGTLQKSYNGRIFSSFEGVPYAQPPIGPLRFEVNFIYHYIRSTFSNLNNAS